MELETKQLVLAIKQIAEEKNLPSETVHDIIEQAIAAAWRRDFGVRDQAVRSIINMGNGDVTVFIGREVVEEVEDDVLQISLDEAKKLKPEIELGELIEREEHPTTFGRVAAQTAKQVILQKLRESEREVVLGEYEDKIGTVISGVIQRVEDRVIRVDLGKAAGILPMSEQIPGEFYNTGGRLKVFLKDVERTNRGPQLILSRANEQFIEYLFRNEVPEMENGSVEIKAIAREAGVRTKIAVASSMQGVDPVGTFVGGHGTRVQAVMSEIGDQEKIDIITYDEDVKDFIKNALSPTEVISVELNETDKRAKVTVPEDQLSIAIGKGGQNVRLASRLSGYDIDIESGAKAEVSTSESVVVSSEPPKKPKRLKAKRELEGSLLDAIATQDGDETKETVAEKSEEDEA